MYNTDSINPLINEIVYKTNDILSNKDIKQDICNYVYLVTIGLVLKYKGIKDDIFSLISKVSIVTKYNDVLKIAKKYNKDDVFKDDKVKVMTFYDKDNDSYVMCIKDDIKLDGILFLELLVKEFNQLLNSMNNSSNYEDGCEVKRSGLYQEYLHNDKVIKIEGNVINEVFNILQSEEIIKLILDLKVYNIECDNVRNILNSFKVINSNDYTYTGNNVLVNIFRRLYNIDSFKDMITNVLLNGNVNELKESIDDALGFDAYKVLDYNLTEAYIDFEEAKISNLKVYDYTVRHCLLRDMINKYISKNYGEIETT